VVLAHDVRDVTIRIAFQGPSVGRDTAATYAADALFAVLNDPASAFQHRLVDGGLFQSVSGYYLTLDHTGPIHFVGKTTPERTQDPLLTLLNELDDLDALEGLLDEDLAIARSTEKSPWRSPSSRSRCFAPELADWWASAGLEYYLGYDARLAAQKLEDLRRFARAYIAAQPRVIGVLAPAPPQTRSPRGCASAGSGPLREPARSAARGLARRPHAAASHGGGRARTALGRHIRRHPD